MSFLSLKDIQEREIFPGCKVRFVHARNMTFAYWDLAPDARIPDHSHPHEQVANFFEGQFELTIGGETRHMVPGDVAIIPSNAAHSGRALTACRILDVFYPVREDYRSL